MITHSRPLYEGVDWNILAKTATDAPTSRPLYEGVDWNGYRYSMAADMCGRPLYEGVDWNSVHERFFYGYIESPSLRGRGLKSIVFC